jgi:hypothetical protein
VKNAAARHGVVVHQVGPDWNVFRLEAPRMSMRLSAKMKAIVAQAESSRAAVGVVLAATPRPAEFEYALTKGAGAPSAAAQAKITVHLNKQTAVSVARTNVTVKSDMLIWRGVVEGTGAPASIMWWPGVTMTGRIQHDGRIYAIRCIHGEMHVIVELVEGRMPPEHAPMPARLRSNDPSLRDDPLATQGDASILRSVVAGMRPLTPPRPVAAARPGPPPAAPGEDIVIDVIVAYTKKAAGHYNDVARELVERSIEESNESFRVSNLGHIKLRLVHAYETDYVEEGAHFDHLWRFADADDGYMEEIHALRDKYRADVAVLIVDDPKGCGLATRVYADQDEAFAVVHHDCAALTYSVAHEIGHLIGARHEINIDRVMTPFPYGHGYVNGTKWRDIMSYRESCGGCPRLPVWSSPRLLIKGEPAGTPDQDNARVIAEQAGRVAAFR